MNQEARAEQERILSIMALARNSRLGEEFHEDLIKSNLSLEQAKSYVSAIFESYSDAVASTVAKHNIDKHISLFTNGYCSVDSVSDFLNGDVSLFISKVYGKLVYSENPRPNFLKVFKDNSKYIITENIFYDRFPKENYIGSIVPECLNYNTFTDERGGSSPIGRSLAHAGYAIKFTPLSPSTVKQIKNCMYIDSDFELETEVTVQQTEGSYKSDTPAGYDKQLFQITAQYYNAIMGGDRWHKLDFLEEHSFINKKDVEYFFKDNYTLRSANNERTCLQRMVSGNAMSRHFDSNTSGYDNYLFNSITWVCQGEFSGRELVLGKRSETDLIKWIDGALNAKENLEAYGLEPTEYSDTCIVSPENFKTVLVNSFNPIFYHGVNELIGPGYVYTIINDFQPAK